MDKLSSFPLEKLAAPRRCAFLPAPRRRVSCAVVIMSRHLGKFAAVSRKLSRHRRRIGAVAAVICVAGIFEVAAAINEWTNSAGTASWADAANWSAQAVPQMGEALLFGDTGTSAPLALNRSFAAGSLNFAAAGTVTIDAYAVSGDWRSLKLTGGTNAFGGTEVLALGSNVTGTITLGQAAGHGTLTLFLPFQAGISVPNAAATLVLGANTTLRNSPTLSSTITKSGAGTLVVNGDIAVTNLIQAAGTLVLNAPTRYTGPTTVTGGTLVVANRQALQSSVVTPGTGVQFAAGLGTATFFGLKGGGSLLLEDAAGAPVMLEVAGTTNTYSGVMSGSGGLSRTGYNFTVPLTAMGLTSNRGAALTLTGANTYSGPTVVSGSPAAPLSFSPSGSNAIMLALDFFGFGAPSSGVPSSNIISPSSPLVFGGADLSGGGVLAIQSGNTGANTQSFAGTTVREGASFLFLTQRVATLTVDLGPITRTGGTLQVTPAGTAGATVNASGALVNGILGGWATVNTFSGPSWATIANGKLVAFTTLTTVNGTIPSNPAANDQAALGTFPNPVNLSFGANGATTDLHTLRTISSYFTKVTAASDNGVLRFGAAGGMLGDGLIGSAVDNGRVTAGGADNTPGDLILTQSGSLVISSRLVDNGSGAVTISKSGVGSLDLGDPANSYTGGTVVNLGILRANAVGTLGRNAAGTAGGDVTVKLGAVVKLSSGTWDNRFSISGNGSDDYFGYGALWLNGSTLTGDIRLVTNASISSNGAAPSVVSGVVNGPGALQSVVPIAGQLPTIFTNAANSFTGGIGVRDGTLVFTTPGALSSDTKRNIVSSGGAIALTFSGVQAVLNRRLVTSSLGTLAVAPANAAEDIDFSDRGANLATMSLGGYGDVTYTGACTANAGVYRLGGGSGTFTYARDITGPGRVVIGAPHIGVSGPLVSSTTVLTGHNTYTGGTSFSAGVASFSSLSDFGTGPLAFTGGTLLFAAGNATDISVRPTNFATTAQLDVGANNVTLAHAIGGGGASGLTKFGTGALTLNAPAAYSGYTTIYAGTLIANAAGALPLGGPVSLSGPSAFSPNSPILALGADQSAGTLSSSSVAAGLDASQILLNGHRLTFTSGGVYSAIRGAGDLVKIGNGSSTIYNGISPIGTTDFTGSVTINGGSLDLYYPSSFYYTSPAATILPPANPVALGGGRLSVSNATTAPVTQNLDQVTINSGANGLASAGDNASATLAAGLLRRTVAGGTLDFSVAAGSSITTKTANTAGGMLGGWATYGGDQFAVSASNGTNAGAISGLATGGGSFSAGGNVDAVGTSVASIPINSLRFNSAATATVNVAGSLQINSGGILLTSTQGSNAVSIDQGTLTSGNGTDVIVIGATGTALTITSKITGAVGLTKSGAGTLTVWNASNDFTGPVTLNGGVLQVPASGVLGNNPIAINGNGGTTSQLQLASGVALNNPISISGPNADPAQGTITALGAATLNGAVTIASEAPSTGSGTFAGPLTVNGPIYAPTGAVISSRAGAVVLAGGGNYAAYAIMAETTSLGAQNGMSTAAVLDIGTVADAVLDLNGHNQTLAGVIRSSFNNATIVNTAPNSVTLTLDVAAGAAYSAATLLSGNLSLVKNGAGTQTLARAQSYTGPTTINGGSFELDFTTATAVTVNAGGTLLGTGSVTALTVAGGGTVAPGALPVYTFNSSGMLEPGESAGVLRTGDLLLAAGAHLSLELGTTALSDALSVTGAISLAGDVQVTLLPSFVEQPGTKFFIALNDGSDPVSGAFSNGQTVSDTAGHLFAINYADNGDAGAVGNDISLTLISVPEPGVLAFMGLAGLLFGTRRRRRK
jgi:autotransporter-associated beta strand protein